MDDLDGPELEKKTVESKVNVKRQQPPEENNLGMIRSRTTGDYNRSFSSSVMTGSKKEQFQTESNDMNSKLAALTQDWNAIKKGGLETITEYKPNQAPSNAKKTGRYLRKAPDAKTPTAPTASKMSASTVTPIHKKPSAQGAPSTGQTRPGMKASTPKPQSKAQERSLAQSTVVSSKKNPFDAGKALEDLEKIKATVRETKKNLQVQNQAHNQSQTNLSHTNPKTTSSTAPAPKTKTPTKKDPSTTSKPSLDQTNQTKPPAQCSSPLDSLVELDGLFNTLIDRIRQTAGREIQTEGIEREYQRIRGEIQGRGKEML